MYDDFIFYLGFIDFVVDDVDFVILFIWNIKFCMLCVLFFMDIVMEENMVVMMVVVGGIGFVYYNNIL